MFKYHLNIYWSEADNAFISVVPELPGCMADGATDEEVVKNIQVAIQEWIEVSTEFDRPIPQPVYGCISAKGLLVSKTDNCSDEFDCKQEKVSVDCNLL